MLTIPEVRYQSVEELLRSENRGARTQAIRVYLRPSDNSTVATKIPVKRPRFS